MLLTNNQIELVLENSNQYTSQGDLRLVNAADIERQAEELQKLRSDMEKLQGYNQQLVGKIDQLQKDKIPSGKKNDLPLVVKRAEKEV